MVVLKFGGTSMGDEHTWRTVLDIIKSYQNPIIVVSATARTTRQLIAAGETARDDLTQALEMHNAIKQRHLSLIANFLATTASGTNNEIKSACTKWINERMQVFENLLKNIAADKIFTAHTKDAVASIGEQLSAYLFAQCGRAYGLPMQWADARNIIKTDDDFGQANPLRDEIKRHSVLLAKLSQEDKIPVMGGFYGENKQGQITTLGFEGSDYTASLIGAALQAEAVEIWTDVSGIYTCDPNVVSDARPIPHLSFQEATELAYFGAKVLHPSTMKPVAAEKIPVFVKNIFEANHPGTKIHQEQTGTAWAKAITYLHDIIILTVTSRGMLSGHQFLARCFEELHNSHIPVNAVTTTEASVSVALQADDVTEELCRTFEQVGTVTKENDQGLISLVGCNFSTARDIRQTIFTAIVDDTPALISYSKTKQNLNVAVPKTQLIPAVCRIHNTLFKKTG